MSRRVAPLLWLLFSAGGTVAAFSYPALLLIVAFVLPFGYRDGTELSLAGLLQPAVVRGLLVVVVALPLFHWAHRFRYTLYDGLQLKHLAVLIAVLCYGSALASTFVAAYLLFTLP